MSLFTAMRVKVKNEVCRMKEKYDQQNLYQVLRNGNEEARIKTLSLPRGELI
jgi:hypothetical protein